MTRRHRGQRDRREDHKTHGGSIWLWGIHAVRAALKNPRRRGRKLLLADAAADIRELALKAKVPVENVDPGAVSRALPREAVHQGVALLADPLEEVDVHDVVEACPAPRRLILLDQVSDPHNLGAILRSAAAFGACGVIVQDRHTPPAGGVLAKAASGALELVPIIRVVNIARTLEELGELGFLRLAFADEASQPLESVDRTRDIVLAFGAEGEGLRRLTRENCDAAVRLPTLPQMPSLNVSNAAAVALYACTAVV